MASRTAWNWILSQVERNTWNVPSDSESDSDADSSDSDSDTESDAGSNAAESRTEGYSGWGSDTDTD